MLKIKVEAFHISEQLFNNQSENKLRLQKNKWIKYRTIDPLLRKKQIL